MITELLDSEIDFLRELMLKVGGGGGGGDPEMGLGLGV